MIDDNTSYKLALANNISEILFMMHTKALRFQQLRGFYVYAVLCASARLIKGGFNFYLCMNITLMKIANLTYRCNSKEFEDRIEGFHFYDYGARFYDPALGRFHSQDRFAEKYTGLTPYHYCGGNPFRYIDVNGDSLDVKNNQQSEIDIKSIVEGNEQSRLIFTGTGATLSVTINYGNMSVADKTTLLENNPGLKLIDDLVNACEKYLYEATEGAKVLDEKGSRIIHTLYDDGNGVLNASAVGKDSDGKYTFLPADGYQGQVSIAETGTWTTTTGSVMKRENMVFHELAESYVRTSSGNDYNKAHSLAFRRERQSTWSLKNKKSRKYR